MNKSGVNKPGVYMPLPKNFAKIAKGMSVKQIRRQWNCGDTVARRWRKEAGLVTKVSPLFKPMPDNFAEKASGLPVKTICFAWKVSKDTAIRWKKEAGLRNTKRPNIPADRLQNMVNAMTVKDAAAACGVCDVTFRKMMKEAGVTKQIAPPVKSNPAKRIEFTPPPIYNATAQYAKDWLQRQEPIWRCREDGAYDFTGSYFRFRGRVWDAAALMEKARDMGWSETRAWSVAA